MKRLFTLIIAVLISAFQVGCAAKRDETPDDEAMKWARFDGKTPEKAAVDYFYPKQIVDYFPTMDAVGQPKEPKDEWPDQLLDKTILDKTAKKRHEREVASIHLNDQEILGRNTWMLWCGGNERFWDWLGNNSFGFTDLLKVIDSRRRTTRFRDSGLINEPGMAAASGPDQFGLWLDVPADPKTRDWRKGYLDSTFHLLGRREHPSQRGLDDSYFQGGSPQKGGNAYSDHDYKTNIPPPAIYGVSTGVVGLRLFPNPYFDEAAHRKWDAKKYFDDPEYFGNPKLVRPYRVGMSCAFCHASFHPLTPPRDVAEPGWENISGNIGAQYLRIRGVFGNLLKKENFIYHVLDSQPPGTIDTSLIASDNINNPNAMNSIFNVPQRAVLSFKNPKERLTPASASLPSLWGNPKEFLDEIKKPENGPISAEADKVPQLFRGVFEKHGLVAELMASNENPRPVPHILFDGADSIGAWGALARVYLNIGTYSEQWERLHKTIVGFEPQKPFKISDCESHSVYWHATKLRVGPLRDYFLKITPPMRLLDTPNGADRIVTDATAKKAESKALAKTIDVSKLAHGRKVFAENCIVCHSSIQPEGAESEAKLLFADLTSKEAKAYQEIRDKIGKTRKSAYAEWAAAGEFWENNPGQWLRNEKYLAWARSAVQQPNFWRNNYLSTDYRVPINVVRTNSARAMATNAVAGNMWEDFSSQSYQKMPSVGNIKFFNPYKGAKGEEDEYTPRHRTPPGAPKGGGGPGFYRVPTLISIWTSAPLLHNNSLGVFNNDPSVDGRLFAFNDAMEKLLWPEKRLEGSSYNDATPERLKKDRGLIWRTPTETYLDLRGRYVPNVLGREKAYLTAWFPWLQGIDPLWLPSAILALAAFLLLWLRTQRQLLWTGIAALFGSLILFLLAWRWPNALLVEWIEPRWLLAGFLLGIGASFVLLAYVGKTNWLWYFPGFVALGIGLLWLLGILVKVLGWVMIDAPLFVFEILHAVETGAPLWILGILLFAVAAFLYLSYEPKKLIRIFAYVFLVFAIALGLGLKFVNGSLGDVRIGPIPEGTPVNLLANINHEADPAQLKRALRVTAYTLAEVESKHVPKDRLPGLLRERIAPQLMAVSRCPDFVMDQGHFFEWFHSMSDEDKRAVIELLKTF